MSGQPTVDISMEPLVRSHEEIVVIGYGSTKRKDLTGSISVVDMKHREDIPFNTVDNLLAGQATGVEVTKTDGTPGGMVRIRIRGASSFLGGNDPLYVIDGIPVQVRSNFIAPGFQVKSPNASLSADPVTGISATLPGSYVNSLNTLGSLDPDDIASITILKDASSAAIYGSKAANGVVVITTRTGRTGTVPRLEVSWSSTVNTVFSTPRLLNASEYRSLLTERARNTFVSDSTSSVRHLDPLTDSVLHDRGFFGQANTNWIGQVTHSTLANHLRLAFEGGGPNSSYFSSISATNAPGVVDNTNYRRIAGKFGIETRVGSKLHLTSTLLAGLTDQHISGGTYAQAQFARPDLSPRDAFGAFTNFDLRQSYVETRHGFLNPVALTTATNTGRTVTILGSLSASYDLSNGVSFKSTLSLNSQSYDQRNYYPNYLDVEIGDDYPYSGGVSSEANSRFTDWFQENTFSFSRSYNRKHAVNFLIGQSFESTKYGYLTATGAGYKDPNLMSLTSADTIITAGGNEPSSPQSYLLSFYARTNYGFNDKYFFTFTGRADGSSKFGSNRFGYFPSGAVAWRISREAFLKNISWLSDLKIRASYGLTGNQNIGDQTRHTTYSSVTYAGRNGLIPTVLGNETILPESTKEFDIGMDASLSGDRWYAAFDFYNRATDDAILTLPVAGSNAYLNLTQNAAGIRNRGFEAAIGGDIVRDSKFKWSLSLHSTWNSSRVTHLSSNADLSQIISVSGYEGVGNGELVNQNITWTNTALAQSKPLGLITGYYITGIIKTPEQLDAYNQQAGPPYIVGRQLGDPMFRLGAGTTPGVKDPQSNVILAKGAPACFGGMTHQFDYKNFDLQLLFTFSLGGHLLWAEHNTALEFYNIGNANRSILDRYTPAHLDGSTPRLSFYNEGYGPTNLDVFSSDYVKLRSLVLGYRIKNIRVYFSATNVFTFTKYPGSDPETSDDAYSFSGGYIDAGNYPSVRSYTIGLKASF
ncbi:SusC/RagA family TonB-linked outer membrane protein [Puia sp. P3]|uniref:SusC/RagA family TonB-linked outer membrane protein n=1 Tax=Puia sp. P3 TaxID=3423952 RepID=UPI003D6775A6